MFGLKSKYIVGFPNKGHGHAWNQVRIDGNWYNVDPTWDARQSQMYHEWDNALQSDAVFSILHGEYKVENYHLPCKKRTGYNYFPNRKIWEEEHDGH